MEQKKNNMNILKSESDSVSLNDFLGLEDEGECDLSFPVSYVSGSQFFVADGVCPQANIAEAEALGLKLQRVTTGRWFVFAREMSND